MPAEEGELTALGVQLIIHISKERVGDVDRDDGCSEEHITVYVLDTCDLCPVLKRKVVAEGSLLGIGLFIVLEDEGVGAGGGVLE